MSQDEPAWKKKRNWCFTQWEHKEGTDEVLDGWLSFRSPVIEDGSHLRYSIHQGEIGTKSGGHHFQGYMEFHEPVSMAYIKKMLCTNSVHLSPRFKTADNARDYCKKTDTHVDGEGPWEVGVFDKNQGSRSDLHEVAAVLQTGRELSEVAMEFPVTFIRYWAGMGRLAAYCRPRGLRDTLKIHVLWGPTGTGKSWEAFHADDNVFMKPEGWWDNYMGEKTVLLDDFYGDMPLREMLRITDIYPVQVKVKTTFVPLRFTTLYITSNVHPREWYKDPHGAFARRITSIRELTTVYVPPDIVESSQVSETIIMSSQEDRSIFSLGGPRLKRQRTGSL